MACAVVPPRVTDTDKAEFAAEYERDGFVIIPRLLSGAAVRQAQTAAHDVVAERHASVSPSWLLGLHQGNQPRPQSWVLSIATDPAVCALAAAVLGSPPVLVSSQLFVKLPEDETSQEVPWHQDGAAGGHTVAFWIALDDIDPTGANGGLMLLPRLHRVGRLPSEPWATTATFDRIQPGALQPHLPTAVRYAFRAGGAGLHGPFTPHASPRNASGRPRRVLVLRYCAEGAAVIRGEALWGPDGALVREGTDPRYQLPCWSSGELIDRRAMLCGGAAGLVGLGLGEPAGESASSGGGCSSSPAASSSRPDAAPASGAVFSS